MATTYLWSLLPAELHTPPPDDPSSNVTYTNNYLIHSTVLGGQIVASFSLNRSVQNIFYQSYDVGIVSGTDRIAEVFYGYNTQSNVERRVTWVQDNPVTGSRYKHVYKSLTAGGPPVIDTKEDSESDAMGANAGISDPYIGNPPPPDNIELDVNAITGDIHDYRSSCKIDGAPTPCSEVIYRVNHNPGVYTLTRINFSRFFIIPQPAGYADITGVAPYIKESQQGNNQTDCATFVEYLVNLASKAALDTRTFSSDGVSVEIPISYDGKVTDLGFDLLIGAGIAHLSRKGGEYNTPYIGALSPKYTPTGFRKDLIDNDQRSDVFRHVLGHAAGVVYGDRNLPVPVGTTRFDAGLTGGRVARTGTELTNFALEEDEAQARGNGNGDDGRLESQTEIRDDHAGRIVGGLLLRGLSPNLPGGLNRDSLRTSVRRVLCE